MFSKPQALKAGIRGDRKNSVAHTVRSAHRRSSFFEYVECAACHILNIQKNYETAARRTILMKRFW
jgi:hypothetical protein